uniref:DUF148 domain-containing protein n=1 Tax=Elaeophora elaphi TaxID=1147741 RepID=A0A0R3RK77_9BILA
MKYFILFSIVLIASLATAQQAPVGQQGAPQVIVPPFLEGAPDDVIKRFFDLLKNDETKTDPQTEADIEAFVRQLGGTYQKFKQDIKEGKAQYEKMHQAAVARFSAEAKAADAKMTAIADSPTLTNRQKTEQIQAIMNCKFFECLF